MTTPYPTSQQPTEQPEQALPWWKRRGILGAIGCGAAAVIALAVALPIALSSNTNGAYLTELRNNGVNVDGPNHDQVINLGHGVCDAFERGSTFSDVTQFSAPDIQTMYTLDAVATAAVHNYCPQYTDRLPH